MTKKFAEPTHLPKERAIIVGVDFPGLNRILTLDDSLSELVRLANTAGIDVVHKITQKLTHPNPATLIGQGKLEEIKVLSSEFQADIVLFDEELSPRHIRVLEEELGPSIKIIDRTALILDIFAQHAATREGALQVELAQYEYRLPRLTRAWTHLARQAGGGGGRSGSIGGVGLRGPGETQLEVDRREIRNRISHLKQELEKVRLHRKQHRARRKKSEIPLIALVGYTNAGKSTLVNYLTNSNIYVADKLFATLDPTTRRIELGSGKFALLTDTVGFIQKLPTMLVAAFHATLEEISEADILLHIVDVNHGNYHAQVFSVLETLKLIGAAHIPIITALNKIDLIQNAELLSQQLQEYTNSVAISAKTGEGIAGLLEAISGYLYNQYREIEVKLPKKEGNLINIFYTQGQVFRVEHQDDSILIQGSIPGRLLTKFINYEL